MPAFHCLWLLFAASIPAVLTVALVGGRRKGRGWLAKRILSLGGRYGANRKRNVDMKIIFGISCFAAFVLNVIAVFFFGFSHSLRTHDLSSCILSPVEWIGRNIGLWSRNDVVGFWAGTLGVWIAIFIGGIIISRKSLSPFWTFLLVPGLTVLSLILTFALGWPFGNLP